MKNIGGAFDTKIALCAALVTGLAAPAALGQGLPGVTRPSGPPTALAGAATSTSIALSWQPAPGATTYMVWLNGKGTNTNGAIQYTATNLSPATKYDFTVTPVAGAWRLDGASNGPSASISVTTLAANQLPVPTNLSAEKGATSLKMSWTGSAGATSYNVVYTKSLGSGWLPGCNSAATTCTILNLAPGTAYQVSVYAGGPAGQSQMSAPLTTGTSKVLY